MSVMITTGTVTNGLVVPDQPLPEGARVMMSLVGTDSQRASMLELVERLPPGPRACPTWDEYEQLLRQEKDAWEH